MAKVDIYHYGSPTSVTNVTLSNCDSTSLNDYAVIVAEGAVDSNGASSYMRKPKAISGSTLTVGDGAITNVVCVTVIQQGG